MADAPNLPAATPSERWALGDVKTAPSQDPLQATTQRDRILVLIERVASDYFIATEETTQNFGEGDTAAEALDALLDALREYRAALEDSDPVLFPDQKRHLAYLASLSVL